MGSDALKAGVGIVTAFIMLAVLSVVLSNKANTTGVIKSISDLITGSLKAATGPVTGSS